MNSENLDTSNHTENIKAAEDVISSEQLKVLIKELRDALVYIAKYRHFKRKMWMVGILNRAINFLEKSQS